MSCKNQRTLGLVQQVSRLTHGIGAVFRPRLETRQVYLEIIAKCAGLNLNILADVDQYNTRPTFASDVKCLFHHQRQLRNIRHQIVVLADRL